MSYCETFFKAKSIVYLKKKKFAMICKLSPRCIKMIYILKYFMLCCICCYDLNEGLCIVMPTQTYYYVIAYKFQNQMRCIETLQSIKI